MDTNEVSVIGGVSGDRKIGGIHINTPVGIALDSDGGTLYISSSEADAVNAYSIERKILRLQYKKLPAEVGLSGGNRNSPLDQFDKSYPDSDDFSSVPLREGMEISDVSFSPGQEKLYVLNTEGNTILIKNIKQDIDRMKIDNN
jgi:DNA-binding beta-propeller fold protein YncE